MFRRKYKCHSLALRGGLRDEVLKGGKIILPSSALNVLTNQNITYPMLFKLTNERANYITHAGVIEFTAEEGIAYVPYWMMRYLQLDEGDQIVIENVCLPTATYSKFQPHSSEFLDISNPKAVLENCLRHFACLTTGDVVSISYNDKVYELCVLETKPCYAVSIIECDMSVDFAMPVDYEAPPPAIKPVTEPAVPQFHSNDWYAFSGHGQRLDGKKRRAEDGDEAPPPKRPYRRGIPDFDYKVGELNFLRHRSEPNTAASENASKDTFKVFSGKGKSLRDEKSN